MKYNCMTCERERPRSEMLAVRVTFSSIKPTKLIRSRVIGWMCSACRESDPNWNRPPYAATPGAEQQGVTDATESEEEGLSSQQDAARA